MIFRVLGIFIDLNHLRAFWQFTADEFDSDTGELTQRGVVRFLVGDTILTAPGSAVAAAGEISEFYERVSGGVVGMPPPETEQTVPEAEAEPMLANDLETETTTQRRSFQSWGDA